MGMLSISVVTSLADVLERENAALAAMDLPAAAAVLPAKTAALTRFAEAVASGSGPWPPDAEPAAARLNRLALENRQLLERAMVAQERVIGIVAGAIASVAAPPAYGATGRLAANAGPLALSARV